MGKVVSMTYASSLTNLREVNSSFDTGILRICYTGKNRNGSSISKRVIERCLPTIYNCPIVCHYDRDTDTLGGHDVEVVSSDDGSLRFVNLTQPIGVIPESAKVWFEDYEEEDGTVHEYLYAEALIWKRQEAYQKIKTDGVTAHSMELTVKEGQTVDGVYHIEDFEFTAFALIGVDPCFEGSALEMFSMNEFKMQLSQMMQEIKENFYLINTAQSAVDDINKSLTEGGEMGLEQKMELAVKYGINIDSLGFSIEDKSVEELEQMFVEMTSLEEHEETEEQAEATAETPADSEGNDTPSDQEANENGEEFALTSNVTEEINRILSEVTVTREWGECSRYWYVDCDLDAHEVYCFDTDDWLLYGFPYSMDGDSVTIDYACKKRKKYAIVDFDGGEQNSPIAQAFSMLEQKLAGHVELESKYQAASEKIESLTVEVDTLRAFKDSAEKSADTAARAELFKRFSKLNGIEAFENLKNDNERYDIESLEEKCYAILGRNDATVKFGLQDMPTKLKVESAFEHTESANEPYGGIFIRRGFVAETN